MLPELHHEALNRDLKQGLKEHEKETKAQIKNLTAVFEQLGEQPEETTWFGIKGLIEEHQAPRQEEPSPELLELAGVSGAEKTEHYEIVMYIAAIESHPSSAKRGYRRGLTRWLRILYTLEPTSL